MSAACDKCGGTKFTMIFRARSAEHPPVPPEGWYSCVVRCDTCGHEVPCVVPTADDELYNRKDT